MLHLFLTKTLGTTTPHSWQQTQNYITKKVDENVETKVLILCWQKTAKSRIFEEIFDEIRIFYEQKITLWQQNRLEPSNNQGQNHSSTQHLYNLL